MFSLVSVIGIFFFFTFGTAKPPIEIPPKNPNGSSRLPVGSYKSVLIVGGGLAGLSAALELADRGYNVTIKEKFNRIGGKLFCIPVDIFPNKTFYVEHGFHAWFHSYYQFKDIRKRLDIDKNFRPWPKTHFIFRNYLPEVIYSEGPYPLNMIEIISRSPNLKWSDVIASALSLKDMMFYDFDEVNKLYDNITFHDWAIEKKVAKDVYDILFYPPLSVTLNERSVFSAAEMLAYIQIFFLTESKADNKDVAKINYYDAVLKPWTEYLKMLNVKFIYNLTVNSLKVDPETLSVYGTEDDQNIDQTVYDYVILAADVDSVKSILNKTIKNYDSVETVKNVFQNINNTSVGKMKVAPEYKVIRVWFDKKLNSSAPDILETPDFTPINLVVQYSLLEEEYINWAQETGGCVIEFHCYSWSTTMDPNIPDEYVWNNISSIVYQIYPEIKNFKVLQTHVNSFHDFASFEFGLLNFRPNVTTFVEEKIDKLYIAGDWIRTPFPSELMERAVSTGRMAANEILLRDGVKQASLTVVNLKGPGL